MDSSDQYERRRSRKYSVDGRRRSSGVHRRPGRLTPPPLYEQTAYSQRCKCLSIALALFVVAAGVGIGIGVGVYPYLVSGDAADQAENAGADGGMMDLAIQSGNGSEIIVEEKNEDQKIKIMPKTVGIDSPGCGLLTDESQNELLRAKRDATNTLGSNLRDKRIVGGDDTSLLSFPWQVSLWTQNRHTCGGSLISTLWVVTAAHCTLPYPHPLNWTVYAGATYLTEIRYQSNTTQRFRPTHVITHSHFDEITYDNDVALMRLDAHVIMSDVVSTICLPAAAETVAVDTRCLISGWGALQEGGKTPDVLQEASVKIISKNKCNAQDWLMGMVSELMICAGEEDGSLDGCQGDSGGPLSCLRDDNKQFFLHGLISWGIGCGVPHMPGVYTDVLKLKNWIIKRAAEIDNTN